MSIDDEIMGLWKQGFNGTEIAGELGLTRNAVMGRLHRLRKKGLVGYKIPPANVIKASKEKIKLVAVGGRHMAYTTPSYPPKLNLKYRRKKTAPVERPPAPKAIITIMDLNYNHCRYITRMESSHGPIYCGEPIDRKSYCKAHADLCYYKITKRNDRPAKSSYTFGNPKGKSPGPFFD